MRIGIDEDTRETVWTIRRRELAVLVAFASTDETRFNMNGVYLSEKDHTISATDGHRAVRVSTQGLFVDKRPLGYFAPLEACADALKRMTRDGSIRIQIKPGSMVADWRTADFPGCTRVRAPDVVFPPIEVYMGKREPPDYARGVAAGISTHYLADLHLIALACEHKEKRGKKLVTVRPGVVLVPPCELDGPWKARCQSIEFETEWEAVIMPMRL